MASLYYLSSNQTFLAKRVNQTLKCALADFWTATQSLPVLIITLQILVQNIKLGLSGKLKKCSTTLIFLSQHD
jgi:hypothetical protein